MAVNYGQVAIVPKGEWSAETQYKVNNLVSYDGSSYVAKVQPPVGTLPTDTSYWQVSAAGTKKATEDSLGTVMPDGTTTTVNEDGKLSVNTARQDALGVVMGSDDITVGKDGKLSVNTAFEQAVELANIIAGEAIKSVLGKVSKAIATTMSLDENALLKNMISGIDVNDSNKVPSSAYIHTLVERIGMGTELASGLGDLTTGLNTVNNNLSKAAYAIPETTLEDILDLSIPDGVYKVVPSTKNLPQNQYGKAEIYSDKANQWRFVRYTTTQPSIVWITFYNGYGSTVGWNNWEQIVTKSDLESNLLYKEFITESRSWKTLGSYRLSYTAPNGYKFLTICYTRTNGWIGATYAIPGNGFFDIYVPTGSGNGTVTLGALFVKSI